MILRPKFLTVKAVPILFWSSSKALTIRRPLLSVLFLVLGLILFGLGEALLVAAGVGVSPWTILAQGIMQVSGWRIGFATFVTSVVVLLLWIPLKQTPGMGTILNVIIISLVLEVLLPFLPTFDHVMLQLTEATLGALVTGFGGGLYLIVNLGPGPRDGLMTVLQRVTDLPIAWVRSVIELLAIAAGWA